MPPTERHDDEEHSSRASRKAGNPLQRGSACLSCRKRKMKCDASKPVCRQCVKANRADECEYDDGRQKSRTQILQEKIAKLEERIRELEPTADLYGEPPGYAETMGLSIPGSHPDSFGGPDYPGDMGGSDGMGLHIGPGGYVDPFYAAKQSASHSHSSSMSGSTGFSPLVMANALPSSVPPSLVPSAYSSTASLAHPPPSHIQYGTHHGHSPDLFSSPGSMFFGLPASPGSSHSGDGTASSASSSSGHVQKAHHQHAQWQQIPQASGSGSYDTLFVASSSQNAGGMTATPFGLPLDMNEVETMFGGGVPDLSHGYSRQGTSDNSWGTGDLSRADKEMLLEIFIPHAKQCGLDTDIARLYQRMGVSTPTSTYPQDPQAQSAHSALANAIYLLACHFSSSAASQQVHGHATTPDLALHEPLFLTLALRGIAAALEEGESSSDPAAATSNIAGSDLAPAYGQWNKSRSSPLVDAVLASALLAIYFYGKARLLEGYYHSSAAARLAVALGMHQIESTAWDASGSARASPCVGGTDIALPGVTTSSSAVSSGASGVAGSSSWGGSPTPSPPLPPPRDSDELAERVSVFWTVFCVDRCWSVATGLPSSLPDDNHPQLKISTVWPWDTSEPNQKAFGSIFGSLYDGPEPIQAVATPLPTKALKSKSAAFFEKAARIASMQQDPIQWGEVSNTELALMRFIEILPDFSLLAGASVDPELVVVHTLAHVSIIQLHHPFAQKDPVSHTKCYRAAETVVEIIRRTPDHEFQLLDPIIGTCWMCASDVFIRERSWNKQQHHSTGTLFDLEEKLSTLIDALNRLSCTFPVAMFQAQKVDQSRNSVY